jgi:hypothetical protein
MLFVPAGGQAGEHRETAADTTNHRTGPQSTDRLPSPGRT